jgi:hypothetical protein
MRRREEGEGWQKRVKEGHRKLIKRPREERREERLLAIFKQKQKRSRKKGRNKGVIKVVAVDRT